MGIKNGSNMDNIVGLLGKGTDFEGKLIFEGTLRIDGKFKGEVITSGILAVATVPWSMQRSRPTRSSCAEKSTETSRPPNRWRSKATAGFTAISARLHSS